MNKTSLWIPISLIAVGILAMIAIPYNTNPWFNVVVGILCLFFGFAFLLLIVKYPQKTKESSLTKYHKFDVTSFSTGSLPKGYDGYNGILQESDLINNFSRLTWQNAEDLVGVLFEKKGYYSTVTQRTGDFGIDVEAKSATEYLGIQVKHWSYDVGFEDIAKTLGVSSKFNKVIVVSTKSGFTSQAKEFAGRDVNIYKLELWDSNRFKQELRQYVIGK